MKPNFKAGKNIAMKIPAEQFEATVHFYEKIIGLEKTGENLAPSPETPNTPTASIGFQFGEIELWLDKVENIETSELWLQLNTDNMQAAANHLAQAGVTRCDEIEDLPNNYAGFWIKNPASVVHLVSEE